MTGPRAPLRPEFGRSRGGPVQNHSSSTGMLLPRSVIPRELTRWSSRCHRPRPVARNRRAGGVAASYRCSQPQQGRRQLAGNRECASLTYTSGVLRYDPCPTLSAKATTAACSMMFPSRSLKIISGCPSSRILRRLSRARPSRSDSSGRVSRFLDRGGYLLF